MDPTLATLMTPLHGLLSTSNLVELSVLKPGQVGLEIAGQGYKFIETPELGASYWLLLCYALANYHGLVFDPPTQPFLSVALPGGHRFQAKIGQGVESRVDISIRLFRPLEMTLDQFGLKGELQGQITQLVQSYMFENCYR